LIHVYYDIILAVTRQKIMHNYFVVYCNIEKNVYSMVFKKNGFICYL